MLDNLFELLVVFGLAVSAYYYLCYRNKPRPRTVRVPGADAEGPFRHVNFRKGLMTTCYGTKTIDKAFENAVKKFAGKPCLGTRVLLAEENEVDAGGKVFVKATYGKYNWIKYRDVLKRVQKIGNGLNALGMLPTMKMAIFLETRAEWFMIIQACFRNNFPVVTVYATLDEHSIAHALSETEVTHVVTSSTLFHSRLKKCMGELSGLKHVIVVENNADPPIPQFDGVTITSFTQLETLGDYPEVLKQPPTKDDLAIIMYTSGQSGDPKGVLINHSNFVAAMSGIDNRLPNIGPSDTYIGYLPLAHVLELVAENLMVAAGVRVGYSTAFTLTDNSPRIKKGTKGDARELQPTLMACVPEIMERMRKTVNQKIAESAPFRKSLFTKAYNYKLKRIEKGNNTPILNALVFNKTRQILGGKARAMLSGGAPLNWQTQAFMNVCMCCPVAQGYGLTETCGGTTICEMGLDHSYGVAGPPLACSEIKLVEWEEGGYKPTQNPPRGEIHIGGPTITQGYFKKPQQTEEDFYVSANGVRWFKTGDIGQITENGSLQIIDRKKDLVKLSRGEYLALGNLEAKLKTSPFIENLWLYANSEQAYCIAFVIPNEAGVRNAVEGFNENKAVLYQSQNVEQLLKKAIDDAAKNTDMQRFEVPQKFYIEPGQWSPDNGLTTAAFKLKRKALEIYYKEVIKQLYSS